MSLKVKDSPEGIILRPITPLEDLAGADAGKITLEQMRKKLDEVRSRDRY